MFVFLPVNIGCRLELLDEINITAHCYQETSIHGN